MVILPHNPGHSKFVYTKSLGLIKHASSVPQLRYTVHTCALCIATCFSGDGHLSIYGMPHFLVKINFSAEIQLIMQASICHCYCWGCPQALIQKKFEH